MEINRHKIVSKRGQKYALDRQNWTTYANFLNMYRHTIQEIRKAGLAMALPEPKWTNRNGEECSEEEALEYSRMINFRKIQS